MTALPATPSTTSIGAALQEIGRPHIEGWLDLRVVAGIGRGDLDRAVFRHYLEQDYVYLRYYARLFARLAGIAPDEHVERLITLAYGVIEVEVHNHRAMGRLFDCCFDDVVPSAECSSYMEFLHEATNDFGTGLVAMMPCLWGYGVLASLMPRPPEGPYRSWLETYDGSNYEGLIERHLSMVDSSGIGRATAEAVFLRGLEHEVAFWNQSLPAPSA